jgi:hypothetical protein
MLRTGKEDVAIPGNRAASGGLQAPKRSELRVYASRRTQFLLFPAGCVRVMLHNVDAGEIVPQGSDCTRRPLSGLCSLTGLEAVLPNLHPVLPGSAAGNGEWGPGDRGSRLSALAQLRR